MTHSEGGRGGHTLTRGWDRHMQAYKGSDKQTHKGGGRRNAQEGGTQKRTIYVTDRQTQTHRQRFI